MYSFCEKSTRSSLFMSKQTQTQTELSTRCFCIRYFSYLGFSNLSLALLANVRCLIERNSLKKRLGKWTLRTDGVTSSLRRFSAYL